MKELDKLRVLLPHWIEHNDGHGVESAKWIAVARDTGQEEVAEYITEAVEAMDQVSDLLKKALEKAGGLLKDGEHHHHHH